jgi:hypothetical protein
VGVTTTVSDTLQEIIKEKGFLTFLKRLKQINQLLQIIIKFLSSLVTKLFALVEKITALIFNIESCFTDPNELLDDPSTLQSELDQYGLDQLASGGTNINPNSRSGDGTAGGRNAGGTRGMLMNKPPSTINARNKDRKIANLVEYNQDTRRGLVWFDPSLCLPNIAPEGEETIYYGGSGTGNEGCRTGTQGTQYTLYLFAGVFYTDPGLTTPFDGGDLWYYDPITNTSYQINSSGVVIDSFPC